MHSTDPTPKETALLAGLADELIRRREAVHRRLEFA
jgi:hypothetical protein